MPSFRQMLHWLMQKEKKTVFQAARCINQNAPDAGDKARLALAEARIADRRGQSGRLTTHTAAHGRTQITCDRTTWDPRRTVHAVHYSLW